jgi:hypothetical protein
MKFVNDYRGNPRFDGPLGKLNTSGEGEGNQDWITFAPLHGMICSPLHNRLARIRLVVLPLDPF